MIVVLGLAVALEPRAPSPPGWIDGAVLANRMAGAVGLHAALSTATVTSAPTLDDLRHLDPGLALHLQRAAQAWRVRPGPAPTGWPFEVSPIGTNDCPQRFEVGLDGKVVRRPR